MSPEKIAIAVAVTIAAIAGIGAMKNVTGTSSAVAIVAVSPGTAPTNSPNSDAASITDDVVRIEDQRERLRPGSAHRFLPAARAATTAMALQQSPRQRNAQELVEGVVDDQRHDERERQDPARAHAEHREQGGEIDGARRDEAEAIDGDDVEHVDADGQREGEQMPLRARPRLECDPLGALVAVGARGKALDDQQDAADDQGNRDDAREQRRAILLPRDPGKALHVNEQGDAEQHQKRTPNGVVELHTKP